MKVANGVVLGLCLAAQVGADYRLDPAAATISFSVREFQPNLPYSGRFNSVALDPRDPRHVLASSDTGGLFRSRDGGSTWAHVSRLPVTNLRHVVFHPDDPSVVLVTAGRDFKFINGAGVWRSTDSGDSWLRSATLCGPRPAAWGISIEPDTGHVYVATECGLMRSTNRGASWEARSVPRNPVLYAVITLGDGLLLAGGLGGVSRSENAGATWSLIRTAPVVSPYAFTVAPGLAGRGLTGRVVYVVDATPAGTTRLWESINLGRSFRQRSEAPIGDPLCGGFPFVTARRAPDPAGTVAFHLYYGERCSLYRVAASFGLWRPGGPRPTPWPRFGAFNRLDIEHPDTRHLAFDDAGRPAFLCTDGGVERAVEDDRVFRLVGGGPTGLNALQIFQVTGQLIDSPPRYDLYFGTQDNSVWASADDGRTWPWNAGPEGFAIDLDRRVATEDDSKVNLKTCGPCANYESPPLFDRMATYPTSWTDPFPLAPELGDPVRVRPDVLTQVDLDPTRNRWGLYSTPDRGTTWTRLAQWQLSDQPRYLPRISYLRRPGAEPLAVAYQGLAASDGRFILARITDLLSSSPRLVFPASRDLGNLGVASLMWYDAPVFAVDPQDPSHLIAANVGAGGIGMKRSLDGGESFTPLAELTDLMTDDGRLQFSENLRGTIQSLATAISFCPDDPNLVLVGTDEAGVFFSGDRGATWRAVPRSDGMRHITSFHWQSAGSVLVSTYGRGLWKLSISMRFPSLLAEGACVKPCSVKPLGPSVPGRPDRTFLVLRGRVTDARARDGRLESLVTTPGSAVVSFSDDENDAIPAEQSFDLGSFEGLEEVGALAAQGLNVLGFTSLQGRINGVLLSDELVEIEEPGPFLQFLDLGRPRSGQEGQPMLTIATSGSLGGVAVLAGGERTLRLRGRGFRPRERISFSVDGTQVKKTARADHKGAFDIPLVLNLGSLPHGPHAVEAWLGAPRAGKAAARAYFLHRHVDTEPLRRAEN